MKKLSTTWAKIPKKHVITRLRACLCRTLISKRPRWACPSRSEGLATTARFTNIVWPPLGLPQPEPRIGHYQARTRTCRPFRRGKPGQARPGREGSAARSGSGQSFAPAGDHGYMVPGPAGAGSVCRLSWPVAPDIALAENRARRSNSEIDPRRTASVCRSGPQGTADREYDHRRQQDRDAKRQPPAGDCRGRRPLTPQKAPNVPHDNRQEIKSGQPMIPPQRPTAQPPHHRDRNCRSTSGPSAQ